MLYDSNTNLKTRNKSFPFPISAVFNSLVTLRPAAIDTVITRHAGRLDRFV